MSPEEFDQKVKDAEENVDSMDRIDGFKDRDLRTIMLALECGIKRPETNGHFDAFVMLRDLISGESK